MKRFFLILVALLCFTDNSFGCGIPERGVINATVMKVRKHKIASWYGPGLYGQPTASGKILSPKTVGIAHRTLPFGSVVLVKNLNNGKSFKTKVIDRGPFIKEDGKFSRDIDLTFPVARKLGAIKVGLIPVKITVLRS